MQNAIFIFFCVYAIFQVVLNFWLGLYWGSIFIPQPWSLMLSQAAWTHNFVNTVTHEEAYI